MTTWFLNVRCLSKIIPKNLLLDSSLVADPVLILVKCISCTRRSYILFCQH